MAQDLIFISIRLLFSLPILRFPLFGAVLAIFIDYFDFEILKLINYGDLTNYQYLDKCMDMLYLAMEIYMGLRWKNNLARLALIILFFYRLVGFGLYSMLQSPFILLIFPNIFEWFYLYYLSYKKLLKKDPVTSIGRLIWILIGLTIPKLVHEYLLHLNTIHPWWKILVYKS